MKFVDEFREPELITKTAHEIRRLADPQGHYRMMEVCGVVGQALPPANPG
jgi:hydrogenase expression/formation protein HypD